MGKFLYTSCVCALCACTHIFVRKSNMTSMLVLLKRIWPEYLMQHNKSISKSNAEDFDGRQFDGLLELRRKRRFTAPPTGIIRRWPSVYCTNNKITSALRIKQYFDELFKLIYSQEPVIKWQCKNNTLITSDLSDIAIYELLWWTTCITTVTCILFCYCSHQSTYRFVTTWLPNTSVCLFSYDTEVLVFIQTGYMHNLCHRIICVYLTIGWQTLKTHYVAQITG